MDKRDQPLSGLVFLIIKVHKHCIIILGKETGIIKDTPGYRKDCKVRKDRKVRKVRNDRKVRKDRKDRKHFNGYRIFAKDDRAGLQTEHAWLTEGLRYSSSD